MHQCRPVSCHSVFVRVSHIVFHTGEWFSGEVVSTDIEKASDGKVRDWMDIFFVLVLRDLGYINVLTTPISILPVIPFPNKSCSVRRAGEDVIPRAILGRR